MMKKVKLAVVAMIIAAGTFGVFAFSDANEITTETDTSATPLHWFDAGTGQYLDQKTVAEQQQECGDPGDIDCAYGYLSNPPVNPPTATATKEE